ncbi:MAG: hypothetical protein MUP21_08250 [Dehalococcoidia bacterium]|nr:hypothetical protein [Dehalococcoidia bacterium]
MLNGRRKLYKTAGIGIVSCWSTSALRLAVALLVTVMALFLWGSCGFFGDDETDLIVTGGQSWSGRNWVINFDEGRWEGCKLSLDITITNTGDSVATFGNSGEGDPGELYIIDKYSQVFHPDKLLPWEKHFYEEKFYPSETRSGTLAYNVDSRSENVWLLMTPIFPEVSQLSFDMGNVPDSCE